MSRRAEPAGAIALLRFATALCASSDLAELEHRLVSGFGRIIYAPMYTLYLLDPVTGRPGDVAPVNVSETFLERYERLPQGRETDPLLAHVLATGGAAYNMALMSMEEFLESPVYTSIGSMHGIRHVIQAPVVCGEIMVGTINLATSNPERGYSADEVRLRRLWAAWSASRSRGSARGRISSRSSSGRAQRSSSPGAPSWSAIPRRSTCARTRQRGGCWPRCGTGRNGSTR
jgi:hypothetical protein